MILNNYIRKINMKINWKWPKNSKLEIKWGYSFLPWYEILWNFIWVPLLMVSIIISSIIYSIIHLSVDAGIDFWNNSKYM
jgi:hypothetical protein